MLHLQTRKMLFKKEELHECTSSAAVGGHCM